MWSFKKKNNKSSAFDPKNTLPNALHEALAQDLSQSASKIPPDQLLQLLIAVSGDDKEIEKQIMARALELRNSLK